MNRETIERYFQQQCSPEERVAVEKWIETQGAAWYDRYFDEHIHDYKKIGSAAEDDAVFMQVLQLMRERQRIQQPMEPAKIIPMRKTAFLRRWWVAAVCVVLLAGIGWLGLQQLKQNNNGQASQLAWTEISNPDQDTKTIQLPDNSQVVLNKGSVLRYHPEFDQKERTVELAGEAYFDVTHDPGKPFIVKAGEASTTVYGTAFNIQAYPQEGQIAVALQRGKIGVQYKGEKAAAEKILTPGQLYQFDKSTGETALSNIPTEQIGSWTSGGLSFYNTPLGDVFTQVERKYGVHFKVDRNVLTGNTFTAYFPEASLERVLQHLQFTSELQFNRQDSMIYVK